MKRSGMHDARLAGREGGELGYVGAIQTFGDLIGWHSHVHAIVSEGLFKRDGFFYPDHQGGYGAMYRDIVGSEK